MGVLLTGRDNALDILFEDPIEASLSADNPYIDIQPLDLTAFDSISVTLGEDTRNSVTHPTNVIVVNPKLLRLKLGDTEETRANYLTVVGYDGTNINGVELTSRKLDNLESVKIK